jgi:hypothetical protein
LIKIKFIKECGGGKKLKNKSMQTFKALIYSFRFPQFFFFISVLMMGFFSGGTKQIHSIPIILKLIFCAVSIFFFGGGTHFLMIFMTLK